MKITKEKLNLDGTNAITYWVDNGTEIPGKAQLIFKEVNQNEFSESNYELLKQIGYENKTIGYFESLYPYGYPHKKEYLKEKKVKGLGKLVIDEMIKDAKENDIDIICGFNSEIPEFLMRCGFKQLCKKNESLYLIISS